MPQLKIDLLVDDKGSLAIKNFADKTSGYMHSAAGSVKGLMEHLTSVQGLLTGLGAGMAARAIIQTADTFTNLSGRLSLVTKGSQELMEVQQRLLELAQESRVGYEQTIDLYTRLARSTKELHLGGTALAGLTETINKSLIISGASAESANAALVQLGQGMASGALRGDELNSVLEQAPRLAEAIAKGMGVSLGQLRELGKEGELTTAKIIKALQSQAMAIDLEFGRMPKTVGQAMTVAKNEIGAFIDEINRSEGPMADLAQGIIDATANFRDWAKANDEVIKQNVAGALNETHEALESIASSISTMLETYRSLPGWMTAAGGMGLLGGILFGPGGLAVFSILSFSKQLSEARKNNWGWSGTESVAPGTPMGALDISPGSGYQAGSGTGSQPVRYLADERILNLVAQKETARALNDTAGAVQKVSKETEDLLKKYLPLEATQKEYAADLAAIEQLHASGALTGERYAAALNNLERSTTGYKQRVEEAKEAVKRIAAAYKEYDEIQFRSYQQYATGHPATAEEGGGDLLLPQIERYQDDMAELRMQGKTTAQELKYAFAGWGNSFSQTMNEAMWAADFSFTSIAKSFGMMLTQMVLQQKVVAPIFAAMNGGSATGTGGVFSWLGSFFHAGGIVGATTPMTRPVSPLAFAGAQRYHNGLLSDEFPAILQRGEAVIPKNLVRSSSPARTQEVRVVIENKGGEKRVTQATPSFDARGMIISVMLEDVATNGPHTRALRGGI